MCSRPGGYMGTTVGGGLIFCGGGTLSASPGGGGGAAGVQPGRRIGRRLTPGGEGAWGGAAVSTRVRGALGLGPGGGGNVSIGQALSLDIGDSSDVRLALEPVILHGGTAGGNHHDAVVVS